MPRLVDADGHVQTIGVRERHGPQQDGVHGGEDRGVRADANRERQRGRRGEAGPAKQRANAEPHVLPEPHAKPAARGRAGNRRRLRPRLTQAAELGAHQVGLGELVQRHAPGVGVVRAAVPQLGVAVVEMLRDLVENLRFTRRRQIETRQTPAEFVLPVRHVRAP